MRFPLYIALRYLFSRKSRNVINVITAISMITVCIVTAALIILLSAFNGLERTIVNLFDAFDPALKITAVTGKSFELTDAQFADIRGIEGVTGITRVIEENVLLTCNGQQHIGLIKGVEPSFTHMVRLDTMIIEGTANLSANGRSYAVIGEGVAAALAVNLYNPAHIISAYYPKRGKIDMLNPFRQATLVPGGIFYLQQEYNQKYVIVPIGIAANLAGYDTEITGVEIALEEGASLGRIQKKVQKIAGGSLQVKNQYEQHSLMYKVMRSEKLAVFLIITLILVIASFNIISALTMLIVEKKKDIMVLWSMGANFSQVKRIYVLEGTLVSVIGAGAGMVIGTLVTLSQLLFGYIRLGAYEGAPPYPVQFKAVDFAVVLSTVIFIGFLASWLRMKGINFARQDNYTMLK